MTAAPGRPITLKAMPTPYDMHCPVARTLDIIGERWTILILRDLLLEGARKFQDFERSLIGISPNTLSARLLHFWAVRRGHLCRPDLSAPVRVL